MRICHSLLQPFQSVPLLLKYMHTHYHGSRDSPTQLSALRRHRPAFHSGNRLSSFLFHTLLPPAGTSTDLPVAGYLLAILRSQLTQHLLRDSQWPSLQKPGHSLDHTAWSYGLYSTHHARKWPCFFKYLVLSAIPSLPTESKLQEMGVTAGQWASSVGKREEFAFSFVIKGKRHTAQSFSKKTSFAQESIF